jgi:hypothetical protein
VIGFPGFRAVAVEPVSMGSAGVEQINIVCRRVYFTLKRLWTTASLTPVGTRRGYNWLGHLLYHCFCTVM